MTEQRLNGTVALVTGASRGGGKGIALVLGEEGATVYVTGRSVRGEPTTLGRPGTIDDTAEELTARGGSGIAVRYTTLQTALGALLVAASERGICSVTLGDREASLVNGLREEFPQATIERVDAGRDEWLATMIARVGAEIGSGTAPDANVPVDIRATAFQWRVWQALQRIPPGETRSYTQIAQEIGAPRAVRAVASACARNRLAVVVPCHRVIRADGSLGGYRWGMARKRELLEREAKAAP
jgi:AraC family transcriptional regulator of adaptative response/methylated-DNA-[protein]-cysteine methyltransferase